MASVSSMVKACHSCKEFIYLDASYTGKKLEDSFDSKHRGHMVQVVNFSEIEGKYRFFNK